MWLIVLSIEQKLSMDLFSKLWTNPQINKKPSMVFCRSPMRTLGSGMSNIARNRLHKPINAHIIKERMCMLSVLWVLINTVKGTHYKGSHPSLKVMSTTQDPPATPSTDSVSDSEHTEPMDAPEQPPEKHNPLWRYRAVLPSMVQLFTLLFSDFTPHRFLNNGKCIFWCSCWILCRS